jgi:hypothetical protein
MAEHGGVVEAVHVEESRYVGGHGRIGVGGSVRRAPVVAGVGHEHAVPPGEAARQGVPVAATAQKPVQQDERRPGGLG